MISMARITLVNPRARAENNNIIEENDYVNGAFLWYFKNQFLSRGRRIMKSQAS